MTQKKKETRHTYADEKIKSPFKKMNIIKKK